MSDRSPNCDAILEKLPLYVGEDLEAEASASVRLHLGNCPSCRGEEERVRSARCALVEAFEAEVQGGGPDLWGPVRAGLAEEGLLSAGGRRGRLLAWRTPRVAAGLAAALVGVVLAASLWKPWAPAGTGGEVVDLVQGDPAVEVDLAGEPETAPVRTRPGGLVPITPGGLVPITDGERLVWKQQKRQDPPVIPVLGASGAGMTTLASQPVER